MRKNTHLQIAIAYSGRERGTNKTNAKATKREGRDGESEGGNEQRTKGVPMTNVKKRVTPLVGSGG